MLMLSYFQVSSQIPSNCDVAPVLSTYYEADVKDMALKWLYAIDSPDTSLIDIPQWCQDTVRSGLAAIFNRPDVPEVDSVFNKYCVHTDIDFYGLSMICRRIAVDVDTLYSWTNNWINLETITGVPDLDTLLARYGFTVYYVYHWSTAPPTVCLSTTQLINVIQLCDSLKSFSGILSAAPMWLTSTGAMSSLVFSDTSNVKYYLFSMGFGTTGKNNWRFKVNLDCSIEFLGSECHCEYDPFPDPINCNILDIPSPMIPCQKLEVYPNPSSGLLTVSSKANSSHSTFSILSLNGQELLKQTIIDYKAQFDISNLPKGIYFIKLINENTIQIGKIIKQ